MQSGMRRGVNSDYSINQSKRIAANTKTRRRAMVALVGAIAVVDFTSRAGAVTQTSTWVGSSSANWSAAANWNPSNTDPSNGNASISDFDVIINSVLTPNVEPVLNVSATIDTLALGTGATLDIQDNTTLTVNGPTLTNNGMIIVNYNQSYPSTLDLVSGTLSGSGSITLDDGGTSAVLAGAFTQSSGHTINGLGTVTAALTNNGTVNANVSGNTLSLQTNNMTNNNLMEATSGANLSVSAITISQGGAGEISAVGANSTVDLSSATVTGGTLTSSSGGIIQTVSGTSTVGSLTNSATFNITDNTNLDVTGNLTDNGVITVNSNQSYASTLTFSGGTLSGSGTITLNNGTSAVLAGTLTQSSGHTINGFGSITAALTNNGIVNGNNASGSIVISGSTLSNAQTIEATTGGGIVISGTSIANAGGAILNNGGSVTIENAATITGGTITAVSPSVITLDTATLNGVTFSANTTTDIPDNNIVTLIGTTLTNNATIVVNSNQTYPSELLVNSNLLLTGSGTVTLNYSSTSALIATGTGDTLTLDTHQTINGLGAITAALINNGTVNSNVNGQAITLETNNVTNNSLMESTGGGNLTINGITITQGSAGEISAAGANSTVDLISATITDGTLISSGGGIIQTTSGTSTIGSLTNSATFNITDNTNLDVTGNLTDNGLITVNSNQSYPSTLTFSGGTLSGSGTITLNNSNTSAVLAGTLTQSIGHTINGFGTITAALTNNGTVNANVNGQALTLQTGPMTNNNLIEATGIAGLNIGSVTITQGTNGQISAAGGTVTLTGGATITGGTLLGSGGGIFQNAAGTSNTIGGLTNNATFNILDNSDLTVSSNIVNNGAITVNSNVSYAATLTANGAITGTGSLVVNPSSAVLFAKNVGGSSQGSLTITGSGYLDLNNNHFYINYGTNPDPVAAIRAYLISGYSGGTWSGNGIDSSAAHANTSYALGYADSADPGNPAGLATHQIEIKYTLLGDANLDGIVNGTDFTILATNLGKPAAAWDQGDFLYTGTVTGADFTALVTNLGKQANGADVVLPASDYAAVDAFAAANGLMADVPEPASAGLLLIAGMGVLVRRRRSV
ncbi:MAG: PEP-CTERM sorting domain-containing protein [Tepidisphaeraceae bacterium]